MLFLWALCWVLKCWFSLDCSWGKEWVERLFGFQTFLLFKKSVLWHEKKKVFPFLSILLIMITWVAFGPGAICCRRNPPNHGYFLLRRRTSPTSNHCIQNSHSFIHSFIHSFMSLPIFRSIFFSREKSALARMSIGLWIVIFILFCWCAKIFIVRLIQNSMELFQISNPFYYFQYSIFLHTDKSKGFC